jgi:hypothetical protein
MDVKVSVHCKTGNVTLFVAKKDKYPSEWRTYTQTATTVAGGLAEVIDTWQPEEERVVFIAVRGNEGSPRCTRWANRTCRRRSMSTSSPREATGTPPRQRSC